ncbi:MAG TPA: NADP-dependent oxidoreductase [Ilumatobacteraceae bacterium]|nr:NADP-dependent oxidoreductase [Ilumatobacteraceae bacterium]
MSRAVVATAFGGPEVLSIVDVDDGSPGPGQIAVDIRAAGVNPADAKFYSGAFGRGIPLPMRVGMEASGVVTAVGIDAVGPSGPIAVGDEVILYRITGGYADRVVVDASAALPKPPTMTFEQAAGFLLTGVTAVHMLTATNVGKGDTVLIHGASGGVGQMAVQLAVLRGARVIGTASPARHDVVRALGAAPVAYGEGLADRVRALAPDGVDVALDTVGTDEAVDVSLELVADRSRIATIAGFGRGRDTGIKLLGGGPGADPGDDIRTAARPELVDLAAEGKLSVSVAAAYPLTEVVESQHAILSGHTAGKIVLVP